MPPVADTTELDALRAQLDQVDAALLAGIRDRLHLCLRIAEHKRAHRIPMMQPHRVQLVKDRAAAFAAENGLDPAFLVRLYAEIIQEACRMEDAVIGQPENP